MRKLVTKESITISWLEHNGYAIKMPSDTVTKMQLCGFLYRQVMEGNQITTVLNVTQGVSRSILYDYRKLSYDVAPRHLGRKRQIEDKLQEVKIIDKQNLRPTKYSFQFTVKELSELQTKPTVSLEKAIHIRDELLVEQEKMSKRYESLEEIENVSLEICQLFASGRITIYESCNRFKVSYLDFFKWVVGNEQVRQMYEDAIQIAKFVTESQIYTVSANMVLERLKAGYTSHTDIVYEAIWVNGKKEAVQKSRRTHNREIGISELIRVIQLLKNELTAPEGTSAEDFESMTDDELMEYVQDVRKRIKEKGKIIQQ